MAFKVKPHHHTNAKAVLGLLIVLLAFGILMLFVTYQENIIETNAFQPFIVLTAIGLGLLAGLFFLINQSRFSSPKRASVSKTSTRSTKKRR